jgi:hypothetical protein
MSSSAITYRENKTKHKRITASKYRISNAIDEYEVGAKSIYSNQYVMIDRIASHVHSEVFTTKDSLRASVVTNYPVNKKTQSYTINILSAIEEAKVLLSLRDDWDENGGLSTDTKTFEHATNFLMRYNDALSNLDHTLEKPFIDITVNGGISLKWENKEAQFYILFNKGAKDYAYYYGESSNEQKPDKIKSGINLYSNEIDEFLLVWFKKYLCDDATTWKKIGW